MLLGKKKANKGSRFLITLTVMGSTWPIRFVVKEEELVTAVIKTALKSYAREGRLPVLGSNLNDFFLYCPGSVGSSGAMSPSETIGSSGVRNFMLCKKPHSIKEEADKEERSSSEGSRGGGCWKLWINKSLNNKIFSH